jgi:hypothetical protein
MGMTESCYAGLCKRLQNNYQPTPTHSDAPGRPFHRSGQP